MRRFELVVEAAEVSSELARRGVAPEARVHVLVEVAEPEDLPMSAIAQVGGGFDWLADEPDLYSDTDLLRDS